MNVVEVRRATVVPCVSSNVYAATLTIHREAMTANHKQLEGRDRRTRDRQNAMTDCTIGTKPFIPAVYGVNAAP